MITVVSLTTGNVKLCDFGIAGQLVESKAKTQSAGVAGYIAPERIDPGRLGKQYDVRADVWSLGEGISHSDTIVRELSVKSKSCAVLWACQIAISLIEPCFDFRHSARRTGHRSAPVRLL